MANESDLPNLARILALRGWDQKMFAAAAGVHHTYVNQMISGRRHNPTLAILRKFTECLGISIDVLLDKQLSDVELRTHLSRAALRRAALDGLDEHPRFAAFVGTPEAPVSVEEWQRLARILLIARPPRKRAVPRQEDRASDPTRHERQDRA